MISLPHETLSEGVDFSCGVHMLIMVFMTTKLSYTLYVYCANNVKLFQNIQGVSSSYTEQTELKNH